MKVTIKSDSHVKYINRAIKLAERYTAVDQNSDQGRQILARYERIVSRIGYDPIS